MGRLPALRGLVRRLPAALIVISGGLAANCLIAAAARAELPGDFFGVNAQQLFAEPSSTWAGQLSAIASGGLGLVRTDARWALIEPAPPGGGRHNYSWDQTDAVVQALAQHGLRWYPVLEYAPAWAGQAPGDQSPAVAHDGDFAAFASALAARYGAGGSFWRSQPSLAQLPVQDYEIWNEENSTVFWPSQANAPERYADLYVQARQAIRAVDPDARAVVGGLALVNPPDVQDEVAFLGRMLAHRPDLRGRVDGVALHPYQATLADLYARVDRVRQAVDALFGPGVPIEVTEVGWNSEAVPESRRAEDLAGLATQLPNSDCGVDRLLVYAWVGPEADPLDPEQWFGIWNPDGSAKASGQAYAHAVLSMRGLLSQPPPSGALDLCPSSATAPSAAGQAVGARGPTLRLRAVVQRRHRRVTVLARCPSGCSLALALMRLRASALAPVTQRTIRFSTRRRRIKLRYPRRTRHLQLNVLATGVGGGRTGRVRHIRVT